MISLDNEIKRIVVQKDPSNIKLLSIIENLVPSSDRNLFWRKTTDFFTCGFYEEALKLLEPKNEILFRSTCHKHETTMWLWDIIYILRDPESKDDIFNIKSLISCCFILKGEVERGIKLLDSIDELCFGSLIDIGRALYDVGRFDLSRKYFDRLSKQIIDQKFFYFDHRAIDGLYKMIILKNDIGTINSLKKFVNVVLRKYRESTYISHIKFRCLMFVTCCFIQTNEVFVALDRTKYMVQNQQFKEICFRDVFFLASQLKAQGYYYKAFAVYRIVDILRQLYMVSLNNFSVISTLLILQKKDKSASQTCIWKISVKPLNQLI